MKQIQIVIPDWALKDVDEIFMKVQVSEMTHNRLEGRGTTKTDAVAIGRYEV